ncbi:MAG: BrnT family toxin [Porticoccaceae bacterium]
MRIEFDPVKDERNIRERGLSFERAAEFDFETAIYGTDDRKHYGEERIVAVGYLDRRLHVICFIDIPGGIRVISFRKANLREATRNGKALTLDR